MKRPVPAQRRQTGAWSKAAALQHPSQASTCRRCGLAVRDSHAAGYEEAGLQARQTHSDRLVEDEAQRARSVPVVQRREANRLPTPDLSPTSEAINPNHQTNAQRVKRSTPTTRPMPERVKRSTLNAPDRCPATEAINSDSPDGCPAGEGLVTPTAGLDRGRRTGVNSVVSIRAACKGPTSNSASAAIPSWATIQESESSSGRTRATGRPRTQGFYGRETLEKAKQCRYHCRRSRTPRKRACNTPFRRLPSKSFTKVDWETRRTLPARLPTPTVRRLSLFRSSRFLIALRVSKSAVLRQFICPLAVEPPQRPLLRAEASCRGLRAGPAPPPAGAPPPPATQGPCPSLG